MRQVTQNPSIEKETHMLTRREPKLAVLFFSILIFPSSVSFTDTKTHPKEHRSIVENANFYILRLDDRLDTIVGEKAEVSKIAEGFVFAEGPVWDRRSERLLFSDVRDNKIYELKDNVLNKFLDPVFTGEMPDGMRNVSANGLTFNANGDLVIAEHGNRRVSSISIDGKKSVLASKKDGRRFNSPNDLVYDSRGNLYFTDPPYGLKGYDSSKIKEMPYNGIYKFTNEGDVFLLNSDLTRPNGIALSPDEDTMYVANSDKENKVIMRYTLAGNYITDSEIFFDANHLDSPGVPDGLKVDYFGNVFATGPGGVLVLSPEGDHLGTIRTGEITANVAWGQPKGDHRCSSNTLIMTASTSVYRCELLTRGCVP